MGAAPEVQATRGQECTRDGGALEPILSLHCFVRLFSVQTVHCLLAFPEGLASKAAQLQDALLVVKMVQEALEGLPLNDIAANSLLILFFGLVIYLLSPPLQEELAAKAAELEDALLRVEMGQEALEGLRAEAGRAAELDARLAERGAQLTMAEQRLQVGFCI